MSGGSLYIALSGIDAAQTGLDTVSENVANANTPGYLSEQVALGNQQLPGSQIGDGVSVLGVTQATNQFTRQIELASNAASSYATQLASILGEVQSSSFAEPSSSGIAEQMNTLFNDFGTVADQPTELAPRQQLLAAASSLAASFAQAASGLEQIYHSSTVGATNLVATVNQQLGEVAALNGQIAATNVAAGGANTLIDARNRLVDALASEIGASVVPAQQGQINLVVGGVALVTGDRAETLAITAPAQSPPTTANTASVTLAASGTVVPVTSGTLGATLAALNTNIPRYATQLNQTAQSLAGAINQQLASGTSVAATGTGSQAGIPLFVGAGGATLDAANMVVNPALAANPMLLAASGATYSPGDGSNAQAVANLETSPSGPGALWAGFVGQVGLDVANANALQTTASATYQQAYQAEQSASGVDVNTQMVSMVTYQQAYQAAAKVISTVAQTLQSLLQSV
jgi:flagellar hook-associated protein 1 FlgK